MNRINVIYWSQTGNTQMMAEEIVKGIQSGGKEAQAVEVSEIAVSDLVEEEVLALGCPAMGAEVLEEEEMEPFVTELEKSAKGKKIALFGSYGWGDGEWMKDWETRMKSAGADLVNDEGLICQETPDEDTLRSCFALGQQLVKLSEEKNS